MLITIVGIIFLVILSTIGIVGFKTYERKEISSYSCNQIETTIVNGDCLPKEIDFSISTECFRLESLTFYYNLNCKDKP